MEIVWGIFHWISIVALATWIVVTAILLTIALYQAAQVLSLIIREKGQDND